MDTTLRSPREVWLQSALVMLDELVPATYQRPSKMYVSVGWPKGTRGTKGSNVIGQCWPPTMSADGGTHCFISPALDKPVDVLAVLLHEHGHAVVGCEHGHKKPFATFCKDVGLVKPWTATTPGEVLLPKLEAIALKLGEYPHEALNALAGGGKKQTTRMRLYQCPGCDQKLRAATDTLAVMCMPCDEPYVLQGGGGKDE